jgi:hypothetical protein
LFKLGVALLGRLAVPAYQAALQLWQAAALQCMLAPVLIMLAGILLLAPLLEAVQLCQAAAVRVLGASALLQASEEAEGTAACASMLANRAAELWAMFL